MLKMLVWFVWIIAKLLIDLIWNCQICLQLVTEIMDYKSGSQLHTLSRLETNTPAQNSTTRDHGCGSGCDSRPCSLDKHMTTRDHLVATRDLETSTTRDHLVSTRELSLDSRPFTRTLCHWACTLFGLALSRAQLIGPDTWTCLRVCYWTAMNTCACHVYTCVQYV